MKGPEDIIVTIDKDGKVEIEVQGVKGEGCEALTKGLEEALGGTILSRKQTHEHKLRAVAQQRQPVRRG